MSATRSLLGRRGIRVGGRRWVLDRYRRTVAAGSRWRLGWVTVSGGPTHGRRIGVEVLGPQHGLLLAHLKW